MHTGLAQCACPPPPPPPMQTCLCALLAKPVPSQRQAIVDAALACADKAIGNRPFILQG